MGVLNMRYIYKTKGTCSAEISFDIENDIVTNVSCLGGCNGNLKAISKLVDGMSAYSSLTILDDGTIGCLVEVGRHHTATDEIGMRIIYYNFSIDWIFD